MKDYEQIIRPLMCDERFAHSKAVAREAVRLAVLYGEDPDKAYTAGILHDICKCMPSEVQLQWLQKSDIILAETLRDYPKVWHAFAAGAYLESELSITDSDILNAVRYHTTARAGMSLLEQITYLADLTSADRTYPDVEEMRALVNRSLRDAMFAALDFICGELRRKNALICPFTYAACTEYGVCANGGNNHHDAKSNPNDRSGAYSCSSALLGSLHI